MSNFTIGQSVKIDLPGGGRKKSKIYNATILDIDPEDVSIPGVVLKLEQPAPSQTCFAGYLEIIVD